MDKIAKEIRSRNMSHIGAKNTKPELLVRKKLFKLGYRYRIHSSLPGKPDITFPKQKIAVFINGCFWHGHGCKLDHKSKSNVVFWENKINQNMKRDVNCQSLLKKQGWKIVILWECEINSNLDFSVAKINKLIN